MPHAGIEPATFCLLDRRSAPEPIRLVQRSILIDSIAAKFIRRGLLHFATTNIGSSKMSFSYDEIFDIFKFVPSALLQQLNLDKAEFLEFVTEGKWSVVEADQRIALSLSEARNVIDFR
ncbi:hypothetical protein L596_025134 [Steinernema carpocapsae]|uniref:Uncharacterized protein n=1 Tax=Steinernema carpocapsae TaxID=34508 RepID=A0A4U5M6X4_STECR|nr:hypothetical protein L596_025134 [Steinernema carpocapsae]